VRFNSASDRIAGESGFTLLEVLIAIAIMSAIAVSIYQITTKTFELREKLMAEGEFYNGIRMAVGVMDRDVSMIYSPMVMVPEPPPQQAAPPPPGDPNGAPAAPPPGPPELIKPMSPEELAAAMGNDAGRMSSRFWMEAIHRSGIRPSRFQGTDTKLSFISVSNIRVYKESPESEFIKVDYGVEDDKTPGAEQGTRVLVKKVTPNAFDDDETVTNVRQKFWKTYLLLPGIKKIAFRYYRAEKEQWQNSWDSDGGDTKFKYPDIVEISLEVSGPTRLHFEGKYYMRPETFLRGVIPSG